MSDKSERERLSIDRRGFIRAGTATLIGTAAAAGTVSAEGVEFERTVDARDLGLDPTGGEPINDAIAGLPDKTLVRFGEGSYLVDGTLTGPKTLGLQGDGATMLVEGRNTEESSGIETLVVDGIDFEGKLIGSAVPLSAEQKLRVSQTSLAVQQDTFGYGEETYGYGGYGGVYPENDDGSGDDGSGDDGSGDDGSGDDGSGDDGSGDDGSGDDGSDDFDLSDGSASGTLEADEVVTLSYATDGQTATTLTLEADADMDLYATVDGSTASPGDADRRSAGPTGTETIELAADVREMGIAVHAVEAGSFDLTVGETTVASEAVAHYPFDGSGDTAVDVAGDNDAAVAAGSPSRVDGVGGSAMAFDGDDALVVDDSPELDLSAGTISMHVRLNGTDNQGFLSKDAGGTADPGHLTMGVRGGQIWTRLQDTDEEYVFRGPEPATSQWHHVVFSFGGDGATLYVDGSEVASKGTTQGIAGNPNPIALGASIWTSADGEADDMTWFLDGALEDVRIYQGQRAPSEIPAPPTPDEPEPEPDPEPEPEPNQSPTAAFTMDPASVAEGDQVTLDASGSSDPDGSIASYDWFVLQTAGADLPSDPTLTGQQNTVQVGEAGAYEVALRVTDDDGATAVTRKSLTVEAPDDGGMSNAILFNGSGDGVTAYKFEVEGEVERVESKSSNETLFGGFDRVDGSQVVGTVETGKDYYVFSGALLSLRSEGEAKIELNPDK